jgi:hypothetical protein
MLVKADRLVPSSIVVEPRVVVHVFCCHSLIFVL